MIKFKAFILCLLLGFFGGHRFYLKRKKTAFVMLFFGLIYIVCLVLKNDGLMALCSLILFFWCFSDLIAILCGGLGIKEYSVVTEISEKIAENTINSIKTVTILPNGNKVQVTLEPLPIYNENKPTIINFISDEDYRVLLGFYTARMYDNKTDLNTLLRPYPYNKYSWNELLQIIWINQNFWKNKKILEKNKIKKCEVICTWSKKCKLTNKKLTLLEIPEMPIICISNKKTICQSRLSATM